MTALYAYAVMRAADLAAGAPDVTGLTDGALRAVSVEDVAVLVGPAPDGEIRRTRRFLLAHARALEAAMARGPLLPMRFGVVAADDAAVSAPVSRRLPELRALLARHDGRAEYGARVSFPRDAALAALGRAEPGFAARNARLAQMGGTDAHMARVDLGRAVAEALDRRRKTAERALMATLKPLAEDFVIRTPEDDVEALRAEFLLPIAQEAAFAAALAAAALACGFAGDATPTVKLVGPAPAYNFVSLSLDAPEPSRAVA